jgi:type I restriction enzyme S subunit
VTNLQVVELGNIAKFINGDRGVNYPSKDDFVESGIPFVNAGHLSGGEVSEAGMNFISPQKFDALGSGKLQRNDIIYCLRGSLGKTAIYRSESAAAIASSLVIIRPAESCSVDYLFHYLTGIEGQRLVKRFDNGSSQPNLSAASVKKYPIPLPPLSEQKRIAEILDRAEALRAKRRAALALLDELTQSIFLDMFGDPVSNPKGWPTNKLSAYCDLTNGFAFRSSDYVEYSQTLNCRMSNIRPNGEFDLDYHPKYLPDSYATKYKNFALKDGDVIIAMTDMATEPKILGVPTLVATGGKSLLLNQRVGKLVIEKPNELAFSFLRQLLAQPYVKNFYRRFAGGGVQINLGKRDLLGVTLIMPPFKLQKLYEERKNGIENQKAQIRKASAELDQLFASLQHRAFRGEL